MRIVLDRDRCVGSGQCVLTAPDVFDQDDDVGLVVLRVNRPPVDREADVVEAARACPARVITVLDD